MRECEQCGQPFAPRQIGQRFCGRECSVAFHIEEVREGVALLRQQRAEQSGSWGDTFHSRALADAELGARGRFGAQERPTINGSRLNVAPIAAPEWSRAWPEDLAKIDPADAVDAPLPDMTTISGEPR